MLPSSSPLPLYYQVARDLERKITGKQLRPGDPLPTELQLCETYGVSRITVRKAMEDLVAKRLVLRQRGVGSFVSEASYANRLVSHVGSLHDAVSYSEELTFRQLSRESVAASAEVAAALRIEPGAEVQKIVRLGVIGDEPISVTDVYLPPALAAKLPRQTKASGSIVQEVEEKAGEPLVKVEQTVSPEAAPKAVAGLLGIKPRAPILQITRVYYAASGSPVEVAVVRYHPQRYTFKIEVVQSLSA
jgi:GntR family transcriptional regulator